MAKMFYTLEEAALKLGMSQEELKELASTGQLQQFRDRDKVMFKRQQIDDLAQEQDDDLDESLRTDENGLLAEPLDWDDHTDRSFRHRKQERPIRHPGGQPVCSR